MIHWIAISEWTKTTNPFRVVLRVVGDEYVTHKMYHGPTGPPDFVDGGYFPDGYLAESVKDFNRRCDEAAVAVMSPSEMLRTVKTSGLAVTTWS